MTVNRLKKTFWPLRPVLLPIWVALAPLRDQFSATFPPQRPNRPVWPLSASQFHDLLRRDKYYVGREAYMGAAARIAAELIERHDLRTALELGPNIRPLVRGADAMDIIERPRLEAEGRLIVHDATVAPWPLADRQFDLFVALQVFEHLADRQHVAFSEVVRVARHAIISLPIDWEMADPENVHHQISNERALSWFAPHTPTRVVEGTPAPKRRLVYVFENLGDA